MDPFLRLARALRRSGVRFVVIGLSGINLHARSASEVFATQDRDLFVPPDPDDALAAWRVSERLGLELWCGPEPLDRPRDRFLAERVIANRNERRTFRVEGVEIPVARLAHIIESKRRAGRDKDRLFFATHAEAIRDLLGSERDDSPGSPGPGGKRPDRRRSRRPRRGR